MKNFILFLLITSTIKLTAKPCSKERRNYENHMQKAIDFGKASVAFSAAGSFFGPWGGAFGGAIPGVLSWKYEALARRDLDCFKSCVKAEVFKINHRAKYKHRFHSQSLQNNTRNIEEDLMELNLESI